MRIAIVSDIHGNLTAFEAVIADIQSKTPDLVLHGGDLALMGAQPAEIIDRIRELGWPGVVGNTDAALWHPEEQQHQEEIAPKLRPLLSLIFQQYTPATSAMLGHERVAWLRELPTEYRIEDLVLVHASPGDLWRAPTPDAHDDELSATFAPLDAATTVYGHIHRPYTRTVKQLTVANSGSVGLPWDGDARASYLLIDDGHARLIRVAYDTEREADLLLNSNYPDAPRLAEMRRTGAFIKPDAAQREGGSSRPVNHGSTAAERS